VRRKEEKGIGEEEGEVEEGLNMRLIFEEREGEAEGGMELRWWDARGGGVGGKGNVRESFTEAGRKAGKGFEERGRGTGGAKWEEEEAGRGRGGGNEGKEECWYTDLEGELQRYVVTRCGMRT
jgi:hypothetical protein